jgi:hypothetical protein
MYTGHDTDARHAILVLRSLFVCLGTSKGELKYGYKQVNKTLKMAASPDTQMKTRAVLSKRI